MKFKNILWYGIAAILIFMPIARGTVRVWSITPVLLVVYTLLFVWLWRIINNPGTVPLGRQEKAKAGTVPLLKTPIMAFAGLAILSFIFSIYKHDSFYALLRLFAYIGVYFLVVNNFDRQMLRRLLGLVILIGTGLSVYGFLQYFGELGHSWWDPKNFLAATFVNHNHFAGYLELVIPATIGMLFSKSTSGTVPLGRQKSALSGTVPSYRKLFLTLALIIMMVVFIFTQSRGGWISLAVSLLVMNIVLIKRRRLGKLSLWVFLLISGIIFAFSYLNREEIPKRIETMTNVQEKETSMPTRFKIWQGTIAIIRANPLIGTGIGVFDWGFYRYRPEGLNVRAVHAHNDYLHMAAEMGMLAPLVMVWLFALVVSRGFRKKNFSSVTLGCAIGVLSLSLHGLVDFNFHIPANMLLFSVFVGAVMLKE